jgi:hypothetical protein
MQKKQREKVGNKTKRFLIEAVFFCLTNKRNVFLNRKKKEENDD